MIMYTLRDLILMGIIFQWFCEFLSIFQKLVPAKIIRKLSIREIREI